MTIGNSKSQNDAVTCCVRWSPLLLTSVCLLSICLTAESATAAQELHVASTGLDTNAGAADSPLLTLSVAVKRLKSDDVIIMHGGTYSLSRQIELDVPGTAIRGAAEEAVVLEHGDFDGSIILVTAEGVTIEGLTFDGRFVTKARGIKGKGSANRLAIRHCEVKHCANHAIDVDGADCRIEDCHIHHNLWWNKERSGPEDAHGIVTMYSKRLLIKACRIHHVSGDCFQCDRGVWENITIEDCDFSNGALEEDMAGFKKGASPGEDGIDTKIIAGKEQGRLIVRHCRFHDFHSSFLGTPAAMNLKENVDVVVDGCDVSNAVVGFRLRGTGRGNMWPTVINCTIRDCDTAVRYEDNLQNFRFVHNTIAACKKTFQRAPEKSPWGKGWVVANNLLVDVTRFPEEVRTANNASLPRKFVDPETLRPTISKRLGGKPTAGFVPQWYATRVEVDQCGKERSETTPTMGAHELGAEQ